MPTIESLKKDQTEAFKKGQAILSIDGDLSDEQTKEATDHFTKARKIKDRIKLAELGGEVANLVDLDGLTDDEKSSLGEGIKKREEEENSKRLKGRTPGEMFVNDSQIKALAKRYPSGLPTKVKIETDPTTLSGVGIKALMMSAQIKAMSDNLVQVNDNATAGQATLPGAVRPDYQGILAPRFTPLTLLQIISTVPTSSNLIQWVREVIADRALNATVVREAKFEDSGDDDGAEVKPSSTFGFEMVEVAVKTIAHHIPVTNTALADLPQLQALIDIFLGRGLNQKLEDQLANGDGTGQNMTGLSHTSGLATQAAAADFFTTTRKALTVAEANAAIPDGWLMAPADVETFDLQQDANARYYGNGPFALGPRTLWGLPIAKCFSLSAGTAYTGELSSIIYYDRQETQLSVGTINDDFTRNIRRILAELRGVVAVPRPQSIVKVTLP